MSTRFAKIRSSSPEMLRPSKVLHARELAAFAYFEMCVLNCRAYKKGWQVKQNQSSNLELSQLMLTKVWWICNTVTPPDLVVQLA